MDNLSLTDSENKGFAGKSAFDGNNRTFWEVSASRTGKPFPHWIQIDFENHLKKITKYALQTGETFRPWVATGSMPRDWQFQGSNDGSSWTILDIRENQASWKTNEQREYSFTNSDSYRYYQLYITAGNNDNALRLYEIEIAE